MAVTGHDVARRARVSQMTVSRVFSAHSHQISAATRERVHQAALELGYRPNAVARSLRTQRTDIIGFYSGHDQVNAHDLYLSEVISGLQDSCSAHRKDLLLHSAFRVHSAEALYTELLNGKVDGLVLFASPDDALVEHLVASPMPAVAMTDAVPTLPSVVADDANGGRLMARHLAERGHKRVMYTTGGSIAQSAVSVVRRLQAFRETADELGMMVLLATGVNGSKSLSDEERSFLTAPAADRPTAVACWNDGAAHQIIKSSKLLGLRVPEDIAVIGFNGIETEFEPPYILTTIQASWSFVAYTAVAKVVELLEGKEVERETVLPVRLITGNTT